MLDDLVQTIETLQKRVKEHRDYLGNYESRTRVALIDPLLSVLGWDVSDPDAVHIEPRTVNGWADYALLGSNRKPVMFVEAKKLTDQDSPIRQTVGYAVSENIENRTNVRYCASTNGDVWEVYDIIAQESVMRVSLARDDAAKCALKLIGLWRRSLEDGSFDQAIEPVFDEGCKIALEPTVQVQGVPVPQPTPAHRATQLSAPVGAGWTLLTGELSASWQNQPSRICLPDGKEVETPSWREVIRAICRWLQEKGILTSTSDLSEDDMRMFIRNDGSSFERPMHMNGGVVLNGNFTGASHVRNAIRLLQRLGQDSSLVQVRLSQ